MNIRIADRYDIDVCIHLMRQYATQAPIPVLATEQNEAHVRRGFTSMIMGAGRVWLAERNGTVGMLACARMPNMWNPEIIQISEVAWWVEPRARGTTAAHRLHRAYCDWATQQIQDGHAQYATMSLLSNSPSIDLDRWGWKPLESTWWK